MASLIGFGMFLSPNVPLFTLKALMTDSENSRNECNGIVQLKALDKDHQIQLPDNFRANKK